MSGRPVGAGLESKLAIVQHFQSCAVVGVVSSFVSRTVLIVGGRPSFWPPGAFLRRGEQAVGFDAVALVEVGLLLKWEGARMVGSSRCRRYCYALYRAPRQVRRACMAQARFERARRSPCEVRGLHWCADLAPVRLGPWFLRPARLGTARTPPASGAAGYVWLAVFHTQWHVLYAQCLRVAFDWRRVTYNGGVDVRHQSLRLSHLAFYDRGTHPFMARPAIQCAGKQSVTLSQAGNARGVF